MYIKGEYMPSCPRSSREVSNEVSCYPHYGGVLSDASQPDRHRIRVTVPIRNVPRNSDLLSWVSVGVVIILVGLIFYRYTVDLSMIRNYIQSMVDNKGFIKPPSALLAPIIFFFYGIGAWGVVLSGLRIVVEKNVRKALEDLVGCFFAFFCAFLLTNYAANVFTEQLVGAYVIIAIGLLVVANVIISSTFPKKK